MIILDLVVGGYVLGAIFVGLQMRRAPFVENEKESDLGEVANESRLVVACDCRRCALRRSRRTSRGFSHRMKLRAARYASKARVPAIRFVESPR